MISFLSSSLLFSLFLSFLTMLLFSSPLSFSLFSLSSFSLTRLFFILFLLLHLLLLLLLLLIIIIIIIIQYGFLIFNSLYTNAHFSFLSLFSLKSFQFFLCLFFLLLFRRGVTKNAMFGRTNPVEKRQEAHHFPVVSSSFKETGHLVWTQGKHGGVWREKVGGGRCDGDKISSCGICRWRSVRRERLVRVRFGTFRAISPTAYTRTSLISSLSKFFVSLSLSLYLSIYLSIYLVSSQSTLMFCTSRKCLLQRVF
ncbi:unnamed protein product [Acanthosepion pharaonis]|uniref:Uncharacterized protein n=1 Tax=Acanthosepion pharaonis TaxID=158019 RepID=A0A812D7I1_ACAPH|nr:unnamed protein product [Sepia pharaonis]